MKKKAVVWGCLPVLVILLLGGCGEVLNEFYLSNHTDEDVSVTMQPRFIEQVDLRAGEVMESIERSVRTSLGETLRFEQNGDEINFILPARTTVFLGFSSGGNQPFETLSVNRGDDSVQTDAAVQIDAANYRQHFSITDKMVGAIVHVLDVR